VLQLQLFREFFSPSFNDNFVVSFVELHLKIDFCWCYEIYLKGAFCIMLRLHMQVWQPGAKQKLLKTYFRVVKVRRYIVYEEDRKPT